MKETFCMTEKIFKENGKTDFYNYFLLENEESINDDTLILN